jgi:hypothetical protein
LFLRQPVSVTGSKGQEPWKSQVHTDGLLIICDPHWGMDSDQAPKDSENAISMIFIKTAFGEINKPILPQEVRPSFLRARIIMCCKLVQPPLI